MNYKDFSINIYTHECKSYCDEEFFQTLFQSDIRSAEIHIIDNSIGMTYYQKLLEIVNKSSRSINSKITVQHIVVPRDSGDPQFQRNVVDSLSVLRENFITTNCKYFCIIESDVMVPPDWLTSFNEVLFRADIIGGIYYEGFHAPELWDRSNPILQYTSHVLSGCTLYKREIIEKFPFRISSENWGAFPDAWISWDANNSGKEYKLANYSKIICEHRQKPGTPYRGQEVMS